ncbi:hypothetical protein H6771_02940 [Candidatus Peribacteria bacterium]|nr:hypothetical protein [Candidatus Peribacteria bacterium]
MITPFITALQTLEQAITAEDSLSLEEQFALQDRLYTLLTVEAGDLLRQLSTALEQRTTLPF